MSLADLLQWALTLVLLGTVATVVLYCVVRGASFAYFRTKLEFLRNLKKDKERHNGNGI